MSKKENYIAKNKIVLAENVSCNASYSKRCFLIGNRNIEKENKTNLFAITQEVTGV